MKLVLVLVALMFGTSSGLVKSRAVLRSSELEVKKLLAATHCRAACLDKFTPSNRTDYSCNDGQNCMMCWEVCRLLAENLFLWAPMCVAPQLCIEGCRSACGFIEMVDEDDTALTSVGLKTVYEPETDQVIVKWIPEQGTENGGTVLYSVLLNDLEGKWFQAALTIGHVAYIKRGFIRRDTFIRVIAVNATCRLSDSKTSYLDSYIIGESYHNTDKDRKLKWKPKLDSINRSESTIGLLTSISWPDQENCSADVQYEVSWNVIDGTMEITGHLYTTSNEAVLTLWPHSLYSVQVNSFVKGTDFHSRSEALIIDTSDPKMVPPPPPLPPMECKKEPGITLALHSFVFLSVFFLVFSIIVFCLIANSFRESMILKTKIKMMALKVKCLRDELQKRFKPEREQPKPQIYHIV